MSSISNPVAPPAAPDIFYGDSLAKYALVQPQDGSITMDSVTKLITMATTNSTGIEITENPRDEVISPVYHQSGEHFFVNCSVRFPSSAKAALENFSRDSTFCLFFQLFGPPAEISPPLKCEISAAGTKIAWERNQTGSFAVEWERPIVFDQWMSITYDITLAAHAKAPIRTYLNGELVHSAEIEVWDENFNPGLQARLQQYRKLNVYKGTIPFEFKPLSEGTTRERVER